MVAGCAAATGNDAGGFLSQSAEAYGVERFLLPQPKGDFSLLGKNFRNGEAGHSGNFRIQVYKMVAESVGQGLPQAGFAGAHKAYEEDKHLRKG